MGADRGHDQDRVELGILEQVLVALGRDHARIPPRHALQPLRVAVADPADVHVRLLGEDPEDVRTPVSEADDPGRDLVAAILVRSASRGRRATSAGSGRRRRWSPLGFPFPFPFRLGCDGGWSISCPNNAPARSAAPTRFALDPTKAAPAAISPRSVIRPSNRRQRASFALVVREFRTADGVRRESRRPNRPLLHRHELHASGTPHDHLLVRPRATGAHLLPPLRPMRAAAGRRQPDRLLAALRARRGRPGARVARGRSWAAMVHRGGGFRMGLTALQETEPGAEPTTTDAHRPATNRRAPARRHRRRR